MHRSLWRRKAVQEVFDVRKESEWRKDEGIRGQMRQKEVAETN